MTQKIIRVGNIEIANDKPMVLFGGMNVLESRDLALKVCEEYVRVTEARYPLRVQGQLRQGQPFFDQFVSWAGPGRGHADFRGREESVRRARYH